MDALRGFLEDLKRHGLDRGHTLGLLHILIGRRVQKLDGTLVCQGLTWRQAAALLKKARWSKDAVRDIGLNPASLPPRDRLQFWYLVISFAKVDSDEASKAGEALRELVQPLGYHITGNPPKKEG
jgi:hypothetical protein